MGRIITGTSEEIMDFILLVKWYLKVGLIIFFVDVKTFSGIIKMS
jgi:hypothetical protein